LPLGYKFIPVVNAQEVSELQGCGKVFFESAFQKSGDVDVFVVPFGQNRKLIVESKPEFNSSFMPSLDFSRFFIGNGLLISQINSTPPSDSTASNKTDNSSDDSPNNSEHGISHLFFLLLPSFGMVFGLFLGRLIVIKLNPIDGKPGFHNLLPNAELTRRSTAHDDELAASGRVE
jgi:hypothetical protein